MNILEEADNLINGQRAEDYGPVTENFERIADLWTTYVGGVVPFTAFDVSNMMILVKVARIRSGSQGVGTGFHRDSFVDIAGYAALAERVNDEIQASWEVVELDVPEDDSFFVEQMDQPATPRVWDSMDDVPEGVLVGSPEKWSVFKREYHIIYFQKVETGVLNQWAYESRLTGPMRWEAEHDAEYGPFTEVLETQ